MAEGARPYAAAPGGVRIAVRLTPRAGSNAIGAPVADADGGLAFRARVTAPPEDGKANAALVKLVAKRLGVAKSRISVAMGAASRRKVLHVEGDTDELMGRLADWMDQGVNS